MSPRLPARLAGTGPGRRGVASCVVVPQAMLAVLAGGTLPIAGVVRLGFLADTISLPILSGYKAGSGS